MHSLMSLSLPLLLLLMFSRYAMLMSVRRSASIRARTYCNVFVLGKEDVSRIVESDVSSAIKMKDALTRSMRGVLATHARVRQEALGATAASMFAGSVPPKSSNDCDAALKRDSGEEMKETDMSMGREEKGTAAAVGSTIRDEEATPEIQVEETKIDPPISPMMYAAASKTINTLGTPNGSGRKRNSVGFEVDTLMADLKRKSEVDLFAESTKSELDEKNSTAARGVDEIKGEAIRTPSSKPPPPLQALDTSKDGLGGSGEEKGDVRVGATMTAACRAEAEEKGLQEEAGHQVELFLSETGELARRGSFVGSSGSLTPTSARRGSFKL